MLVLKQEKLQHLTHLLKIKILNLYYNLTDDKKIKSHRGANMFDLKNTRRLLHILLLTLLGYSNLSAETLQDFLNDTSGNWEIQVNPVTDGGCDGSNGNLCSSFVFGSPIGVTPEFGSGGLLDNEDAIGVTVIGPSGIAGDGLAGFILIRKTSVNGFVVTDYQVDPYLNTPAGTIATRLAYVTGASGSISNDGILTLDLTGRTAGFQFFTVFGEQEWNRDDSSVIGVGTGNYELFTTAASSNINPSNPPELNETINGRSLGDINSDGILDAILVSAGNIGDEWGPFTGTPYAEVYNINLVRGSPASPRIVLDIEVPDGTEQECSEEGGSIIELVAEVRLFNEAELGTIEWFVDGTSSGFGETFSPFISLGAHTIDAVATAVQSVSDSETVDVNITDRIPPALDAAFVNSKTGAQISQISNNSTQFVGIHVSATDICDHEPSIEAVVTPVTAVENGDIIAIKPGSANKGASLDTTALELSAVATDASGRQSIKKTVLNIGE